MARRGRDQPRERLSRERILAAAAEVAEHEGVDALSMRRLAQELDVWPMSVYRYFQDKDALLDAMAAAAAGRLVRPSRARAWPDQMTELLDSARRSIARPSGIGDRLPRAFFAPEALRVSEAGMSILVDAGFPPAEAAAAWRALWSYTFGFATFRVAPTPEQRARGVRAAIAAVPEDDYPVLASAREGFAAAFADDDAFAVGLELMLDGLRTRAEVTQTR
jgi:AcrR family transcriptional regulator